MADTLISTSADHREYKQQLRNELRAQRRALTPAQQQQASLLLLRQLMKLPQLLNNILL